MPDFPAIPTWDSLHPLLIHFPIVLLLLSPLFILISAVLKPPRGRPYMNGAILILAIGTISLFAASATGRAAAALADRGGPVDAVLAAHQDLASESEIVFSALLIVLVGMVVLPNVLSRHETRLTSTWLPLAFLVLYSAGILLLVNTAHAGGRLVHQFGVHAMIPAATGNAQASPGIDHPVQIAGQE